MVEYRLIIFRQPDVGLQTCTAEPKRQSERIDGVLLGVRTCPSMRKGDGNV
jgi:hypothetical protein